MKTRIKRWLASVCTAMMAATTSNAVAGGDYLLAT